MSKSNPWHVQVITPGEEPHTTYHRSAGKRDKHVASICGAMRAGTTNAHTIIVRYWDPLLQTYCMYEMIRRIDEAPDTTA